MSKQQDRHQNISRKSKAPSQKSNPPSLRNTPSQSSKLIRKENKLDSIKSNTGALLLDTQQYPQCIWEASYIDGKYYLSDPYSLQKLRELEEQIEAEKQKLASIEDTQHFQKSFLSHQHLGEGQNFQVLTEINESRLFQRKKNAEEDLLDEENRYRKKIDQMKKKRSQLKHKIGTNQKNIQANQNSIREQQQQNQQSAKKLNQVQLMQSKKQEQKDVSQAKNKKNQEEKIKNIQKYEISVKKSNHFSQGIGNKDTSVKNSRVQREDNKKQASKKDSSVKKSRASSETNKKQDKQKIASLKNSNTSQEPQKNIASSQREQTNKKQYNQIQNFVKGQIVQKKQEIQSHKSKEIDYKPIQKYEKANQNEQINYQHENANDKIQKSQNQEKSIKSKVNKEQGEKSIKNSAHQSKKYSSRKSSHQINEKISKKSSKPQIEGPETRQLKENGQGEKNSQKNSKVSTEKQAKYSRVSSHHKEKSQISHKSQQRQKKEHSEENYDKKSFQKSSEKGQKEKNSLCKQQLSVSQKNSRASRSKKSSQKRSSGQKQRNLNLQLPQPSNKSSKVHAPLFEPINQKESNKNQSQKDMKVRVNYVNSDFSESRSAVHRQHHDNKIIHDASEFKSEKGSNNRSEKSKNQSQNSSNKQSERKSYRSRSKRSEIMSHIDKSNLHTEKLSQQSQSVKDRLKEAPSISKQSHRSQSQQQQQQQQQSYSRQYTYTNQDQSKMASSYQSESHEPSYSKHSQSEYTQSKNSKFESQLPSESQANKQKSGFIYNPQQINLSPTAFKKGAKQSYEENIISPQQLRLQEKLQRKSQASKKRSQNNSVKDEKQEVKSRKSKHSQTKSHHKDNSHNEIEKSQKSAQIDNSRSEVISKRSQGKKLIVASESEVFSEKKPKSFIIHSRQHSNKSRSRRGSQRKQSLSKDEVKNSPTVLVNDAQALKNKQELKKLKDQVKNLHQKLKIVEQKQESLIKFENNQSNIMNEVESSQGSLNEPVSPLGKFTLTSRLKLQKKLSLSGSTVQFNTFEQKKKLSAEESQRLQKLRLQEEVGHLKKIIRDMQMEKIKSIQNDHIGSSSRFEEQRNPIIIDHENKSRISQQNKQSLNSDVMITRKNLWTSDHNFSTQQIGKIVKNNNSPGKSAVLQSPRRLNRGNAEKLKQFSEHGNYEPDHQHQPLPLRKKNLSSAKDHKTKEQLFNQLQQNEKDFQNFLQSSRMMNQPESQIHIMDMSIPQSSHLNKKSPISENLAQNYPPQSLFQSHLSSSAVKKDLSDVVQRMRKQNPQDEQLMTAKPIQIGSIQFPQIPGPPTLEMSQGELVQLAKQTYAIFGIIVDESDPNNQLSMKKYKNCVVFSLSANSNQCILWHYSGKFYMGGWKNNDASQGEKTGEGIQYLPGKHVYQGQFLGGKKNGTGIIKMNNGNIYEGQWVDGVKNGRGVYLEAHTKTLYSGQWSDGKRDGYGLLRFTESQFYQGTFKKSVKHGFGIQRFANGDIYKGEYQKGRFYGKGKYIWANGSSYQGDFVDGSRHGQGCWKSSRHEGDIYVGLYENDKKSGYGRYVWVNGCVYEGYFKNDLKNGKGRLIYQDGKQIKGTWQDGNLVNADNQARKNQNHQQEPLRRSIRVSSLRQNPHSPNRRGSYI